MHDGCNDSCSTHASAFFAVASGHVTKAWSRSARACECVHMLMLPPHFDSAARTLEHAPMTLLLPVLSHTSPTKALLLLLLLA